MAKKNLKLTTAKSSAKSGFRVSSNGIAAFNPSVINQTGVNLATNVATTGIATANIATNIFPVEVLNNPILNNQIQFILPLSIYTPKEKVAVPLSPVTSMNDEVLFDDAKNNKKKYYLPQYRVGVQQVSGEQQFRISLKAFKGREGGQLSVYLEKYAASKIAGKVKRTKAAEIPHKVEVALSYIVPTAGNLKKELRFQEITLHKDGVRAKLNIPDLREYAQIYNALSTSSYQTKLLITRNAQVAFPKYVTQSINKLDSEKHKPDLVFLKKEDYEVRGNKFTRVKLSVRNRHLFPDALFKASPDLPPCGKNNNASRTWVNIYSNQGKRIYGFCGFSKSEDLSSLWFAYRRNERPPSSIYVALEDRRAKKKYISNTLSIANSTPPSDSPLYKIVNSEIEGNESFVFPREAFGYIYGGSGLDDTTEPEVGYTPYQVSWEGTSHTYLQDTTKKERIFYLPDEFQLTRLDDGSAHLPWFRIEYRGSSESDIEVQVSYRISGYVSPERLENAYTELSKQIKGLPSEGLIFEPLRVGKSQLSYKLALPGNSGYTERNDVLLDLQHIDDELPWISIQEFMELFQVLINNDQRNNVLRGQINVKLDELSLPAIPVSVRFGDMIGEVLSVEKLIDPKSKTFKVGLKNMTESTISMEGLSAKVRHNDRVINASYQGLDFPVQILPGAQLPYFSIIPQSSISDLANAEIIFDWEDMDVLIEQANIYHAIVDQYVTAEFNHEVNIKAYAFMADPTLLEIKVDFRNTAEGPIIRSVTLEREEDSSVNDPVEMSVALPLPIKDYVLGLPTSGHYWFRITAVSPTSQKEGAWQMRTGSLSLTSDIMPKNVNQ